jgi:GntR family transcriptional repressor for pyruvate dehydrogenase complex
MTLRASLAAGESVRRPRTLAQELVQALVARIREGRIPAGQKLPTEAAVMAEFGVSRTVVREALSQLQAAGLVQTRHGIGTFALAPPADEGFRVDPQQLETLRDVIALLELRIALETEAAALAARRRTPAQLELLRAAVLDFDRALQEGRDAVEADFRFHAEVARATQNEHFSNLLATLGTRSIPRARLEAAVAPGEPVSAQEAAAAAAADAAEHAARQAYLRRVNAEHESILDAIAAQDAEAARAAMRTHLANSRERRRRAGSQAGLDGE